MNSFQKPMVGLLLFSLIQVNTFAQTNWPKEIPLETGGRIILYQLQPETVSGNRLTARAAFSIREKRGDEPIFGAMWLNASLDTDKAERTARLESIQITEAKFPVEENQSQVNILRALLLQEIPKWKLDIPLDELIVTMDGARSGDKDQFKNDPPEIIYTQQPTRLVLIDGEPFIKPDDQLGVNRLQNSASLIVQQPNDNLFYYYTSPFWYQSTAILTGWTPLSKWPRWVKRLNRKIKKLEKENQELPADDSDNEAIEPPIITVRTKPAELIQSLGQAQLAPIQGTNLLYVVNTESAIFMDVSSQLYYVVLSGRWYRAASLQGRWSFVPADSLPGDFAQIPEGSTKAEVLAYVPGTEAAREAIQDAQIPQTAKVDRKKATCRVTYDGAPQFEPIEGTNLFIAVNASNTVLRANASFYCVENGVWFIANNPAGPWAVSVERPIDVNKIPPSSPAYPVKYVYIYDIDPDYVYMGYTAGYSGCYVYGPTILFGTGFYYRPWYGKVYLPRPFTWGFSLQYNPWAGWHFGFGHSWFTFSPWFNFWRWWGPPRHLEQLPRRYNRYPNQPGGRNPRISSNNNVYRYRNDVVTRNLERDYQSTTERPSNSRTYRPLSNKAQPSGYTPSRQPSRNLPFKSPGQAQDTPNDVYSDRSGKTYQRDRTGNWQQREGKGWRPTSRENNPTLPQVQRDYQLRERGSGRVRQQPGGLGQPAKPTPPRKLSGTIRLPR
ncbi:hypothetical protein G8759_14495 [Spirosoma aureum]|uniref:Carbohydrate-binding family V/XII n=1 Tax=Spirosoma aureum TaxID=2692134 RepID=A0A6G9AMU3_9BACT|nr:hypothetical protein [Spirosoma aureum]QIP13738.1 hypothetical protein G8759_14495 [Spirosoma aureum]